MSSELRFDDRVAIVTGAGNGLGRSHALLLAQRGAKVVVNDLGGSAHGEGKSSAAADRVVAEIREAGGEAVANYDSVEDGEKIVQTALDVFGRVDIVINNAGILRDVSFHKMTQQDWDLIYRVHVYGSFKVTHAAWPHMRDQQYGRVIMTSSAAGLYGNFGQANYSTAKLGLLGFGFTLAHEGRKRNIHVNTIAPVAGSRMTETILPPNLIDALKPEYVSPLVALLCHERCEETGGIFEVGGGMISKLRWQRTNGKLYRIGREITPELLRDSWDTIVDFGAVNYPRDAMGAIQPVLDNIEAGPSKGGNKYIDVDAALGFEFPAMKTTHDERDLALYALGVGAARDPMSERDLKLVYELHQDGFVGLPTYGVIPALNAIIEYAKTGAIAPGLNFGAERILHGEQRLEVRYPVPRKGTLRHSMRVRDIWDKGKHALVVCEATSRDEDGNEVFVNEVTLLVKGAGGWGGERGPSQDKNIPPDRAPDAVVEETLSANQALLYRLSGDFNPLHADPGFAKAFGFDRPILHGLCTFGHVGRHVINAFADGDPRLMKSIDARFADSVFPGERLVTEMWKDGDRRVIVRAKVKERDSVVISNAAVELHDAVPEKPKKAAPKPAAAGAAAPATPIAADVFAAMREYITGAEGITAKVGKVFQFKLSDPASVWTVDIKNGGGEVAEGETQKPDCTLEMSDADFMAMTRGEAKPQKLFGEGRLRISGDIMASQKLSFLGKLDPTRYQAIADARAGAGGGQAAAADAGPSSGDVFIGIRDHVARHPELVDKVGKIFQFRLTAPDSVWTIDVKNAPGAVAPGEPQKPDCILELTDADFMAMTDGSADPQKLYFSGKLKISGDIMASQKLSFLQKIDPEQAKAAIAKARAEGGQAAAAAAASAATPAAPKVSLGGIMVALESRLKENWGVANEIDALLEFRSPSGEAWTVDLRAQVERDAGRVREGASAEADVVFTVAAEDLVALARGEASTERLFQTGKLRVDGEIRLAHGLGMAFKGLL
ncbi:MAG: SDR family NAD(P)-dependent oxidoreductase [Myxococcales bacterium]|nr:SDR family NAD(P)-dependent oxidoreductase [Myxococcales bacterium]